MADKVEHQHFIPRSYLKNFAEKRSKKKYFLDGKRKVAGDIARGLSVRDVCVQTNLYTLRDGEVSHKYVLEKFYAENVDGVIPEVYKILLDKNVTKISKDQKNKIIYTLISLYFRTPKFLNNISKSDDAIFEHALQNSDQKNVKINWNDGTTSSFNIKDAEVERLRRREFNRLKFLISHFDSWHDFVFAKDHGTINIFSVDESIPLITSDNPVQISSQKKGFDIFSPSNYIQMPLDTHHLLWISPVELSTDKSQANSIFRQTRDESFALTSNHLVEQLAESWIFGFPGTVDQHINDQQKFNTASYCEPLIERAMEATRHLENLYKLIERHGLYNPIVATNVHQLRQLEVFQNSHDLDQVTFELVKAGHLSPCTRCAKVNN